MAVTGRVQTPGFGLKNNIQPTGPANVVSGQTYFPDSGADALRRVERALGIVGDQVSAYAAEKKAAQENVDDAYLPGLTKAELEREAKANRSERIRLKATTLIGTKEGTDFYNDFLQKEYEANPPEADVDIREWANQKRNEYATQHYPIDTSEGKMRRLGFMNNTDGHIDDLVRKHDAFNQDRLRQSVEDGARAHLDQLMGPQMADPKTFITDWNSFREGSGGNGLNPGMGGANVDKLYMERIVGKAAEGDVEWVKEVLNSPRNGFMSIARSDPLFAQQLTSNAEKAFTNKKRDSEVLAYNDLVTKATNGEGHDDDFVDAEKRGLIDRGTREELVQRNRVQKQNRIDQLKLKTEKERVEAMSASARNLITLSSRAEMTSDFGGTSKLRDQNYISKDGKSVDLYTVEQQIKDVTDSVEAEISGRVSVVAKEEPEAAEDLDLELALKFYTMNSDLKRDKWSRQIGNFSRSAFAVINPDGSIPTGAAQAFKTYSALENAQPGLGASYTKDSETLALFEIYRTEKANGATEVEAIAAAQKSAGVTTTINDVPEKHRAALISSLSNIDNGWNDGRGDATLGTDVMNQASKLYKQFVSRGMLPEDAIKSVTRTLSKDMVQVDGALVRYEVTDPQITKELFRDGMSSLVEKGRQTAIEAGADSSQLGAALIEPRKTPRGWVLYSGSNVLTGTDGSPILVTPDQLKEFARETQDATFIENENLDYEAYVRATENKPEYTRMSEEEFYSARARRQSRTVTGFGEAMRDAGEKGMTKAYRNAGDKVRAVTGFVNGVIQDGKKMGDSIGDHSKLNALPITAAKKEFLISIWPGVLEASRQTGVDPRIIAAQAAHESAWGKRAPGNNLFGIKGVGNAGSRKFTTHEVVDGNRIKIKDSFAAYDSTSSSVLGYAQFLLKNPRYRKLMEAKGLDDQLKELGASGYATDPNYATAIGRLAATLPNQ